MLTTPRVNLFPLIQRQKPSNAHPANRASLCLLLYPLQEEKRRPCLNRVKITSCSSPNFCISQYCFLSSNSFFEWTIPRARLLGPELNLYPSNKQRMLNKDPTRYIKSLCRVRQNRVSKRKALLQGGLRLSGVSAKFKLRYEIQFNSFCQQVDDWRLLRITENIFQENAFEQKKPG